MKAILLCHYKESKLFPYDLNWQPACLPIVDTTNVERIVKQLLNNSFLEKDIYVIIDHRKDQVQFTLRHYANINYVTISNNDLKSALKKVSENFKEDFLIYYGNSVVTDSDVEKFLSSNYTNKALVIKNNEPSIDHICANVENDKIKVFLGHPREHYVTHKVSGIFSLSHDSLKSALQADVGFEKNISGAMPPQEYFFENGLNNVLETDNIYSIEADFEIFNLKFPWDLLNANEYYINKLCSEMSAQAQNNIDIDPSAVLNGFVKLGKNSIIGKNVVINGNCIIGDNVFIDNGVILEGNNYIGDNTYIKDYAKIGSNSVIGKDNKIGHNAEIKGLTMDGVSAVHYSEIFGVIGKYVDIAAACVSGILRFNDSNQVQKIDGKTYSGKNTNAVFIGDFTRTGINNIFLPGCKIGSNCALYPGLIVDEDIAHGKIVLKKQELIIKEWGSEKYGW